jgi:hypothetical protein
VPHPISQNEASVPTLSTNVNTLPNRGLERVEILRDGASSIYGTDAVAGVVNYVTAKNFRGTELSLRYGETRYGDGGEYRATLTHGLNFAKGKGRAMITADFYSREAMYARDRAFSAESDLSYRAPAPWNVSTNTTFNLRSATTQFGNYLLGSVTGTDAFQGLGLAAAALTEAEVFAHHHQPGLQLPHQHLLHEGLGAEGRQRGGEGHQHQLANPQRFQQMELLGRQVEPQPRFAEQHFPRVGPKAHHRGHQRRRGAIHGGGDHPAVPLMQAVKAAQGDGRGRLGLVGAAQGNHWSTTPGIANRTAEGLAGGILPWQLWATPGVQPATPWPIASTCS